MTTLTKRKTLNETIFEAQRAVLKKCLEDKWRSEEIKMALQCQEFVTRMAWADGKRIEKGDRLW